MKQINLLIATLLFSISSYAVVDPILGPTSFCTSGSITLTNATPGGTWSSSTPAIAVISSTGVVMGLGAGTATITYTVGIEDAVLTITVNPAPTTSFVSGGGGYCAGGSGVTIGLNTSSTGVNYELYLGGIATGITLTGTGSALSFGLHTTPGNYTVIATNTVTTCSKTMTGTANVAINPLPTAYTLSTTGSSCLGAYVVLSGSNTGTNYNLLFSSSGSTWSSVAGAVPGSGAIINFGTLGATGFYRAVGTNATTGCTNTMLGTATLNPTPVITGPSAACVGAIFNLTSSVTGTWTSSTPTVATVTTGTVTAVATGTSNITVTAASGCSAVKSVTVAPSPGTITGPSMICVGNADTYTNSVPGGVWSGSGTIFATGSLSGVVTGVTLGTGILTYSLGSGCTVTKTITINAIPGGITGPGAVCIGNSVTLAGPGGGTWSSSNPAISSVNPTTGDVTGMGAGMATISYTIGTGCSSTKNITVVATPTAITGLSTVCAGSGTALTSSPGGGTWSSSNTAITTVGAANGITTGVSAGLANITYSLGTGCYRTIAVVVNPTPIPYTVSGGGSYCAGSTSTAHITLSGSVPGISYQLYNGGVPVGAPMPGTGSALDFGVLSIAGTYTVRGSNTTSGCSSNMIGSQTLFILPMPSSIAGPSSVCIGNTINLTSTPAGGVWTSSTSSVATIDPATGILSGAAVGSATISYSLGSGCATSKTINVTPSTCTGTPTGGAATSFGMYHCYGNPIALDLYSATTGCGIMYQWQESTDGTTYTDIAGATSMRDTVPATATQFYRCKVTCSTTGLFAYSSPVTISAYTLITSHTIASSPDTVCNNLDFYISACGSSSSLNVTTWFGDGTSTNTPLTLSGVYGAHVYHSYNTPGTYNIKQVLYVGTVAQDSVTFSHEYNYCRTLPVKFYVDINNSCAFDAGDKPMMLAVKAAIDSNGIPVDTLSATSGFYYRASGPQGTIYTFRIISVPAGMAVTCPVGSVLRDTIVSTVNNYQPKYFGFNCASGTGSSFDLVQRVSLNTGRHAQQGIITVSNTFCAPQDADVTLHHNPRYRYSSSTPPPLRYTDSTVTWHLTNISSGGTATTAINYWLEMPWTGYGAWFMPGDTVRSTYVTMVPTGDIDSNNNRCTRKDTVRSSWDPNDIAVSPSGYVLPCTKLQYTIRFENDGNDTAHNIHVMDTLSNDLDINSLEIEIATAAMNIAIIKDGPYQIAKFDFPNIKLLDSSHHNECQGMIIYNINTKAGIADGTVIPNKAAIYFDDNEPVITNTISNVIGIAPITGPNNLCIASTMGLENGTTGGTWSSGNAGVATIGSATGIVTSNTAGTTTIAYSVSNSCSSRNATTVVTVNTAPAPITGAASVCTGVDAPYGSSTTGGTWTISNPTAATINASGVVSGLVADTATITYTLSSSCQTTKAITINTSPAAITGPGTLCNGTSAVLSDITSLGAWSSSNNSVAVINSSGMVTTGSAGVTNIAYTLGNGCSAAHTITVYPTPASIAGTAILCSGTSTTLTDATPTGTWSSSNASVATIYASSGMVNGIAGGIATITYAITTDATTCAATKTITINPSPSPILGTTSLCAGVSVTLTNGTAAGLWSSSNSSVATIGSATGVVTGSSAGTAIITYLLSTGCNATKTITVQPTPAPISGIGAICNGASTTLTNITPSGTWSAGSSVATINASGVLTGVSIGVVNITYALAGCNATKTITVNPVPAPITGTDALCSGTSTTYTNATPAGNWSAGGSSILTIGAATGLTVGIAAGTTNITYTLGTGCTAMKQITVNPTPAPVTGTRTLCSGTTTTLSDVTPGGTWSSSGPSVATIGASGLVSGLSGGVTTITYLMSTGCSSTAIVTVHTTPAAISGADMLCSGTTSILTDAIPGGTWSGSSSVASVGAATGIVTGITSGTVNITYSTGSGCMTTKFITVNPQPAVFSTTGGGAYCSGDAGVHIGLSSSAVGVNYFVYRGSTATGPFAGTGAALDFGYHTIAGAYNVSAINTTTTCQKNMPDSAVVTVTPSVTPSVNMLTTPGISICEGTPVNFTPVALNGGTIPTYHWIINGLPVATSSSYTFYPANGDMVTLKLTSNAICARPDTASTTVSMTVHKSGPLAVSVSASPGLYVAVGETVTFTATVPGGSSSLAYQWLINGITIPGATNPTYITNVLFNGDVIKCEVDDNGPCSTDGSSSVTISLNTTGIVAIQDNSLIDIYPNPNNGSFTVKGSLPGIGNGDVAVQVMDILGRVIHTETVTVLNGNIDAHITMNPSIANGVYVLSLQSGTGKTIIHFIVEQ